MRRALPLALLAACGCAASMVEKREPVVGPVEEVGVIDAGGGKVRYALKGPGWLVRRRRGRAMKLMEKQCGGEGRFRVTGEETREDVLTPYNQHDLSPETLMETGHYRVEEYRYVDFKCLKP